MIRTTKTIFLVIGLVIIISFLLPGCYTQLSRPRVDTEDEYYDTTESEEVDEYYQDEDIASSDDSRDVYIYNYYPYSWYDYDYWYGYYYNPYRWRYVGPYPDYWWDPYGRWWMPGWYVGFSYYDYYWGGYPHYYNSYYRYGYYVGGKNRTFFKRPFDRRTIGSIDRNRRIDTENTLSKPLSPSRVKRPGTTLSTPSVRDKSISPDRKTRTIKEMVDQRLRSKSKIPRVTNDQTSGRTPKDRPTVRTTRTIKNPSRSKKSTTRPKIIRRAPTKSKPVKTNRSYSAPKKSTSRKSKAMTRSRSSSSRSSGFSRPTTRSFTPRSSSSSRTTTRSTPTRSSSSGKSSSSSSKSSGASRTKK